MAVRRLPSAEHLPTALEVECHILIAKANASLHSSRRSATRLPRKCGVACGAGDYIAVTIWSWTKSPGRFARFLQAGCALWPVYPSKLQEELRTIDAFI